MNKFKTIILMMSSIAFSGCEKTAIEGKIFDGFGTPVKEATIKVEGTQFVSQTDGNGRYSVGYVPGDIKVLVSKSGFTETSFSVKISTESTFPAEDKTIYEIPKEQGIWYMDFEKKQHVPIKKSDFISSEWTSREPMDQIFYKFIKYESYKVQMVADKYTSLKLASNNSPFIFLDNDLQNQNLIKLEHVNEDYEILYRKIDLGMTNAMIQNYSDKITILQEDHTALGNGLFLRKVNLEVGNTYAFVNYSKINSGWIREYNKPIQGLVYLFTVENNN